MDRHLDNKHSHEIGFANVEYLLSDEDGGIANIARGESNVTCVADLCPILGRSKCERVGKEIDNASLIGSSSSAVVGFCNEEEMEQNRQECYAHFNDCFGNEAEERVQTTTDSWEKRDRVRKSLNHDLQMHFCERLTCHQSLRELAGQVFHSVHDHRPLWETEHNKSAKLGSFGVLIVIMLGVFYVLLWFTSYGYKKNTKGGWKVKRNQLRKIKVG